jgi:L-asparaginase II
VSVDLLSGFAPVAPLVEVRRGGRPESVHYGVGLFAAQNGEILSTIGGAADASVFPRSALKPFQLEALLSHPAAQTLELSEEEVGVLTASHDGELAHVALIDGVLRKVGADRSHLRCGLPDLCKGDRARPDQEMVPIFAECSGKHAAMLALSRLLECPFDGYLDRDHPTQVAIRQTIVDRLGVGEDEIATATDGCGAPAYQVPLGRLAVAYAQLAAAGRGAATSSPLSRIASAMMANPTLIAGSSGRVDTESMLAAPGLVAKTGREGVLALAHVSGVSCVIKVSDGDPDGRAASCVAATVLELMTWAANERAGGDEPPNPRADDDRTAEVASTPELQQFVTTARKASIFRQGGRARQGARSRAEAN